MPGSMYKTHLKILLTLVLLSFNVAETMAYEPPDSYIPGVIGLWEKHQSDDVGFSLSTAFINWPSIFLLEMNQRPQAFSSWLDSINKHTANRNDDPAEPGRGLWTVRRMHELAAKWDGVRYREMMDSIQMATEKYAVQPSSPLAQ